ncbi:MAG: hypothetical protein V1735_03715 [Nanoarchaeota archaeon]
MIHPFLRNVEAGKEFVVVDGAHLRNLDDLALLLEVIEDVEFQHHVTVQKNDFATWVQDVIKDVELADALLGMGSAEAMSQEVKRRIRELRVEKKVPHESITSRVKEFIYGLLIGYVIGMLVARLISG